MVVTKISENWWKAELKGWTFFGYSFREVTERAVHYADEQGALIY